MSMRQAHFRALLSLIASEKDAAAFVVGYLLTDITDQHLCDALRAWTRHCEELAKLDEKDPEGPIEPE